MSSVSLRLAGLAAALFLSACDTPRDPTRLTTIQDTYAGVDTIVRQVSASDGKACSKRGNEAPVGGVYDRYYNVNCAKFGPVLVATVADTNNLNQTSPFGRIVAEQIETRLTQLGFQVVEAHMANSMVMNPNGQFILSRDLRALARQQNAGAVLVGTYLDASNQALGSLKLVRVADDVILGASDYVTKLPDESRSRLIPSAEPQYRPLIQPQ
jgi:TolB-like protein